jgi:hypothetical protein
VNFNPLPPPRSLSYRTALTRRKIAHELSKELLDSDFNVRGAGVSLPFCTVVFEIVDTSNDEWSSVGLTLRQEVSTQNPLRVLYDHAVICAPTQRSTVAMIQLCKDYSFTGICKPGVLGLVPRAPGGMRNHCIRVLPLNTSRQLLPSLPAKIIRRIAAHAFVRREPGFRASLLSFSLVCKAWFPVLDMFYEGLGMAFVKDRPVASLVSRALKMKPEKEKLITRFSTWDYVGDDGGETFSEGHLSVLTQTTAVKEINVSSIDPHLVDACLKAMSALSGIKKCTVSRHMAFNPGDAELRPKQHLEIMDILKILPYWDKLRVLHINQPKITDRKG